MEASEILYVSTQPIRISNVAKNPVQSLIRFLIKCSFLNLLIVSCIGIVLRSFSFFPSFPLEYINILHGHSHFAFGGWVMPILVALLLKAFPEITSRIAYKHWRNIAFLMLTAAYGMLISFPIQGYKAVSITFSTLSVIAGYYLAVVIWKAAAKVHQTTAIKFLKAGLFYLTLSSIGPFATGPLIAMGKMGTPVYYDAIYFYLHFQYNGFFTFAILSLLYKFLENGGNIKNGNLAFTLFNGACFPAYFLSVLWSHPSPVFNIIGGVAALLQVAGLIYIIKDSASIINEKGWINIILKLAIAAFIIKNVLQLVSAFPAAASLAYNNRNFVIGYLHLVLLGFISLFAFGAVFKLFRLQINPKIKWGLYSFLFAFVFTELLIILLPISNIFNFSVPAYTLQLLVLSCFFPAGILLIYQGIINQQSRLR